MSPKKGTPSVGVPVVAPALGVPSLTPGADSGEHEPAAASTPIVPSTDDEWKALLVEWERWRGAVEEWRRGVNTRFREGAVTFAEHRAALADLGASIDDKLTAMSKAISDGLEKVRGPQVSWWTKLASIVGAAALVGSIIVAIARGPGRTEFDALRDTVQENRIELRLLRRDIDSAGGRKGAP